MAHAQKPDFVFRRNGRVNFNLQGSQFDRLLAAEVCPSAVVMLDTPCSEVVKGTGYTFHSPVFPSLPLSWVTVCHHVSTGLYFMLPLYFKNWPKRLIFPLSVVHRVSELKNSAAMTVPRSLKISWMDIYSKFYDGWLRTARNWLPTIAWIDQQKYHKCSATTCIHTRRQKGVPSTV